MAPQTREKLGLRPLLKQFTQGVGIQQIHTASGLPAGGRVGNGSPALPQWCRSL
jgi:hypothetical protein